MTRALLGSAIGSVSSLLLILASQTVQQAIAINATAWPVAIALSAIGAFVGGFVKNPRKPRGWRAVGVWAIGWIGGVLIVWLGIITFSEGD